MIWRHLPLSDAASNQTPNIYSKYEHKLSKEQPEIFDGFGNSVNSLKQRDSK